MAQLQKEALTSPASSPELHHGNPSHLQRFTFAKNYPGGSRGKNTVSEFKFLCFPCLDLGEALSLWLTPHLGVGVMAPSWGGHFCLLQDQLSVEGPLSVHSALGTQHSTWHR